VLTGREGCFSAGADLSAVPSYGPEQQRQMVVGISAMALGVYGLPFPVVGAITGHAIAGGLVLALCADLRVASSAGRYGLTEIKVGVPYPQAAIGVIRAELAPHAARLLAFGNQLVDAAECLRLGVFDEIVEPRACSPVRSRWRASSPPFHRARTRAPNTTFAATRWSCCARRRRMTRCFCSGSADRAGSHERPDGRRPWVGFATILAMRMRVATSRQPKSLTKELAARRGQPVRSRSAD
jgi:enoyl-CoA hydratase/carnithine racemase